MDKDNSASDNSKRNLPDVKDLVVNNSLTNKFVGPSLLLFLDSLFVSIGGWLYWIMISRLTFTSQIGIATTIYSLVILAATIAQLGIEYPLLKKSNTDRSQILGTALFIEIAISIAALPVVILIINNLYGGSLQQFSWIASVLLVLSAIGYVTHFIFLGIYDVKKVIIIDVTGLIIKFVVGYTLLSLHFGAFGMLLAFLAESLFLACTYLLTIKKRFAFKLGKIAYFKEILKDSLVNSPSKLSKIFIINLSIVLLGSIGVNSSDVGVFYVALMISIVVGAFASSMAFMVIPASSGGSMKDLSSDSLRISLSVVTPVIVALLVAPKLILSPIGLQFERGAELLIVLAVGILPSSITINVISRLNNLGQSKKIVFIGIVQMSTFILSFFLLAEHFETLGAAYSILLAFTASAIISVIWSGREMLRHTAFCCLSIIIGTIIGYVINLTTANYYNYIHNIFLGLICSVSISIIVIFMSKNLSVSEIRRLVSETLQRN